MGLTESKISSLANMLTEDEIADLSKLKTFPDDAIVNLNEKLKFVSGMECKIFERGGGRREKEDACDDFLWGIWVHIHQSFFRTFFVFFSKFFYI